MRIRTRGLLDPVSGIEKFGSRIQPRLPELLARSLQAAAKGNWPLTEVALAASEGAGILGEGGGQGGRCAVHQLLKHLLN